MTDKVRNVSQEEFVREVEAALGGLPVLVDFSADYCAPCRAFNPVLEALAEDWEDRLRVLKVDVEAEPELAARFRVKGVPTLQLFRAGQAIAGRSGALSYGKLREFLEGALAEPAA